MQTRHIFRTLVWLLLCIFSHSALSQTVIINKVNSTTNLSLNATRAIFSMRLRQWPNGEPITVYVFPENSAKHRKFVRETLSMRPHQLQRSWNRYTFSGLGMAPIVVNSEQEMIEKIRSIRGSIGYIIEEPGNVDVAQLKTR